MFLEMHILHDRAVCAVWLCGLKAACHDTDTDILADIFAKIVTWMSVSVSWNAGFISAVADCYREIISDRRS